MNWLEITLSILAFSFVGSMAVGHILHRLAHDAEREVEAHIAANYPDAAFDVQPVDLHGVAL